MNEAQANERYDRYLTQVNDSLPVDMPDEERQARLIEALDAALSYDIDTLSKAAKKKLTALADEAMVDLPDATHEDKLAEVRQALAA